MSNTTLVDWDNDHDTELVHEDDGFVYRRKRRLRTSHVDEQPSASTHTDLEQQRRLWKRNKLIKLKSEYSREIQHWEFLADSLRRLEEQTPPVRVEEAPSDAVLVDSEGSRSDRDSRVVDELLVKVEAQEATISHVSNLCDVAESVCSELEEKWSNVLVDLSVWDSSPRKLMAFLQQ